MTALADKELLQKKRANIDNFIESCYSKRAVVTNTPLEIQMEICNTCNIDCRMCASHGTGWSGRTHFMPTEVCESVYPLFENLLVFNPQGFGEPLLHKDFEGIVRTAKSHRAYVYFFTNGTLINRDMARFLVEEGVDRVVVSFDGGTKRTYEDIHRGASFDRVVANLRYLDALKKLQKRTRPELGISYIAMQSNFGELPQLFELAATWGGHDVVLSTLLVFDFMAEMEKERKVYDPKADSEIIKACEKLAAKHNILMRFEQFIGAVGGNVPSMSPKGLLYYNLLRYIESANGKPFCLEPFRMMYVKADGNIMPCCAHHDCDYLGNANEQSLLEIWNGKKFVEFREKIINDEMPGACATCVRNYRKPTCDYYEETYLSIANFIRESARRRSLRKLRRLRYWLKTLREPKISVGG